ncbi:hypothetical protein MMC25_003262 [Agyrium rufum]|nr:hypothetical protein [Agyrium rufum]
MATLRPKNPNRSSTSGKDIFSRMLHMEEASKRRHDSPDAPQVARPITQPLPSRKQQSTSSPTDDQQTKIASTPPRSQTTPDPGVEIERRGRALTRSSVQKPKMSASEPPSVETQQDPAPSICRSPSWSDYGQEDKDKKERKKQEKAMKEAEKVQAKNAPGDNTRKPGKRLSKRPPAAMETQRMPMALRSQSADLVSTTVPTTVEEPRQSSSRERRRSSISSMVSLLRFSRDSSKSRESGSVPQSPQSSHFFTRESSKERKLSKEEKSMANASKSQPTSSPKNRSKIADKSQRVAASDDGKAPERMRRPTSNQVYDSDLLQFAGLVKAFGQPDNMIGLASSLDIAKQPSPAPKTFEEMQTPPPSRENVNFTGKLQTSPAVLQPVSVNVPKAPSSEKSPISPIVSSTARVSRYMEDLSGNVEARRKLIEDSVAIDTEKMRRLRAKVRRLTPTKEDMILPPPIPRHLPAFDGQSYVQNQRASQQQRSIDGYEDELALQSANSLLYESAEQLYRGGNLPPTPNESIDSIRESGTTQDDTDDSRSRTISARVSTDSSVNEYHEYIVNAKGRTRLRAERDMSKAEKLLGQQENDKMNEKMPGQSKSKAMPLSSPVSTSPTSPILPPVRSSMRPRTSSEFSDGREGKHQKAKTVAFSDDESNHHVRSNVRDPSTEKERLGERREPDSKRASRQRNELRSSARGTLPRSSTMPVSSSATNQRTSSDESGVERSKQRRSESSTNGHEPGKLEIMTQENDPEPSSAAVDSSLKRTPSLKRPQSDSNLLNTVASASALTSQQSLKLDFIPDRHQPLTKPPRRTSVPRDDYNPIAHLTAYHGASSPTSTKRSSIFPAPIPASSLHILPPRPPFAASKSHSSPLSASSPPSQSTMRHHHSSTPRSVSLSSTSLTSHSADALLSPQGSVPTNPIAKMFVICCQCRHWHDLPSKLYEAMAMPRKIDVKEDKIAVSVGASRGAGGAGGGAGKVGGGNGEKGNGPGAAAAAGVGKVYTSVACPWCEHGMSTACCEGWTAVVRLYERHH